jgi:hypothetical protein
VFIIINFSLYSFLQSNPSVNRIFSYLQTIFYEKYGDLVFGVIRAHTKHTPWNFFANATPTNNQMAGNLVCGGEKAEILLASRLLKFLIKLGLIFII